MRSLTRMGDDLQVRTIRQPRTYGLNLCASPNARPAPRKQRRKPAQTAKPEPVTAPESPTITPGAYIFECATEFFYIRPDGTPGTRWFSVQGIVQWVGVHPNPYGAGNVGTPKSLSYGPSSSWVRYWHSESSGCLRTWRIHGGDSEQLPVPLVSDLAWHEHRGIRRGRAGFPVALPLPLLSRRPLERAATPSATPTATGVPTPASGKADPAASARRSRAYVQQPRGKG